MFPDSEWLSITASKHSCPSHDSKSRYPLYSPARRSVAPLLCPYLSHPYVVHVVSWWTHIAGFVSSLTRGTAAAPDPSEWFAVSEPHRRIWASLKYRSDRPVLSAMELVSLPSKRIHMNAYGIRRLVSGKRSEFVKPLGMGEIAIIKVKGREKEWIEAREAVSLNVGGEVICRAR